MPRETRSDHDEPEGLLCPVCATEVPVPLAVGCARCGSPHHRDCWFFARMCSRFGCGGKRFIPYRRLPQELVRTALEIDTRSDAPDIYLKQIAAGLQKLQRAELDRSMAHGLKGGLAAVVLALLWLPAPQFLVMFLGIGLLFGWLAPSVAPLQVRFPERMAIAAAGLLLLLFAVLAGIPRPIPLAGLPVLAAIGVTSITMGASIAEWLLGRRQVLGKQLGGAAPAMRHVVTGLGSLAGLLLGLWISKGSFHFAWILDSAPFVFAAMFAGGHPLEKAKALFEEDWGPEPHGPGPGTAGLLE